MPPNNPAPPTPNYDFILNHGQKTSRFIKFPAGSSRTKRYLIAGGGAVIIIIAIIIGYSLIFGGKDSTADLVSLAAQQQEIIRVADLGIKGTKSSTTLSYAFTVKLSVETSQQRLLAVLKSLRKAPKTNVLNSKKDVSTDTQLTNAAQSNQYDTSLTTVLNNQLTSYAQTTKTAFSQQKGPITKAALADAFNGINVILKTN